MFAGKLATVAVGAEIVDIGMVVSLGKGLFVEARLAQLLSSARITMINKRGHCCISSAMKFFIEKIS